MGDAGVLVVTIVLVAVVMGSSQAMRAAWIEDLLSLIPPIAFLIALRVARMAPTRARPTALTGPSGWGTSWPPSPCP